MTAQDAFERRLRDALVRHTAGAPNDFDALGFARMVAAKEPRRRGFGATLTLPVRGGVRARLAWVVLAATLLLAISGAALVAGLWRDDPIPVPATERIESLSPDADGNGPSADHAGIALIDPRLVPVGPDEAWARDDRGVWHYLDATWSGPYAPEAGPGSVAKTMAVAPDGSVWYGTAGGVAVLRDGAWTTGVLPETHALAVASDGTVWSVTTAGSVQRYDPRTGVASWVTGCSSEPSVLAPGPDGTMYVGTFGYSTGRVYVVRGSRCEPLDPLGDDRSYFVGDLAVSSDGRVLAVLLTDPNATHDPPVPRLDWTSYVVLLDEGRWTVLDRDVHPGNSEGVISGWDQVAFAPDGSIWRARMKEEGGGIERWDGSGWDIVVPDVEVFSSMSFGPDGSLWFEGESRLFRIRPEGLRGS